MFHNHKSCIVLNCVRFLEERIHDDIRLMRVAIQPKLARKSSDHFWREMQRLCSSCAKERKIAVQKWMPEPLQHLPSDEQPHAARADAVKRFSHIFDRHFAVRHTPAPNAAHVSHETGESNVSHETGSGAHATAHSDVVDSGDRILSVEDDLRSPDMDTALPQAAEVEAVADDKQTPNKRQRQ